MLCQMSPSSKCSRKRGGCNNIVCVHSLLACCWRAHKTTAMHEAWFLNLIWSEGDRKKFCVPALLWMDSNTFLSLQTETHRLWLAGLYHTVGDVQSFSQGASWLSSFPPLIWAIISCTVDNDQSNQLHYHSVLPYHSCRHLRLATQMLLWCTTRWETNNLALMWQTRPFLSGLCVFLNFFLCVINWIDIMIIDLL